MTVTSKFRSVLPYLPPVLRQPLDQLPNPDELREIRLRLARPMQIIRGCNAFTVTAQGCEMPPDQAGITVTRQILDNCFQSICGHSVHSWQAAIRQGFVTIAGGCRVGLCGTAVMQKHQLETVRNLSGLNIRIASERIGCAEALLGRISPMNGGLLIAGAPASGKTTVLRDIARFLGDRHRVSILDERGELAAVQNGIPQFMIGAQTDVFDGYPKAEAIEIAVRVMSPEYLICDEIGNEAETDILLQSLHTGVRIIASAHAGSLAELRMRPQIRRLTDAGVFRHAVLLGSGAQCGQVLMTEPLRSAAG
ncbi:MAG: Flp pilus assembly complex ATPase component TadA [Oscillospiraceae bacterium]|nr:Flp pilus assembly complex ATPase component TadA [Oscillospiraceae bacterium]